MKIRDICILICGLIVVISANAVSDPIASKKLASFRQGEFLLDTSVITIPGYGEQYTPVVASDGTNFLLVWAEFRNIKLQIFGARVDQNGVLLDTIAIPIATKAESQHAPAVAFGGSCYLVVWKEYHEIFYGQQWGYGSAHLIYGARVSTDGIILDTNAILISNSVYYDIFDNTNPEVTFDGTNFYVAWVILGRGIYGVRVSQAGIVFDAPRLLSAFNDIRYDSKFDVTFGGSYYLVTWERKYLGYNCDSAEIRCARVSTSGLLVDTNAILVTHGNYTTRNPVIASDSQNFLIVWEKKVSQTDTTQSNIYGARVTQTGAVLDTAGIQICTVCGLQRTPAIAFDGSDYFVVWKDYRNWWSNNQGDIYGTRVSTSGIILDSLGLAITKDSAWGTTDRECYPEVAFGNGYYLAVWQHGGFEKPTDYDVFAARVLPSGVVIDSSGFSASTQVPGHQYSSASVFDGANYFVVWNDYHYGRTDTSIYGPGNFADYSDIYGIRVSETGVVLDESAIKIISDSGDQVNPNACFDGVNYMVVWEHDSIDYLGNLLPGFIKGSRITPSGIVIDTSEILIAGSENGPYAYPTVSFDGSNYLVVYYDMRREKVVCRRVAPTGVVIDPADIVIADDEPHLCEGGPSAVAFDGANYMVIWTHGDYTNIYSARISPAGVVLDTIPIVISNAYYRQWRPAVAFDGTNYLIVWEDWRNASGNFLCCDIYGARVTPMGIVLDPQGIPISVAFNDQECPDVGFDGTNYVVVWQDLRDTFSYDIYSAKVSSAGNVGTSYPIVTGAYDQIEPSLTRGNSNAMLMTYTGWTSLINNHSAHTMRIWGKTYPFTGMDENARIPAGERILSLNAYPNPCWDRVEITWTIPGIDMRPGSKNDCRFLIYDVTGRMVRDLSRVLTANNRANQTSWDLTDETGRRASAGVYFIRLEIPGKALVEKVVLIK